MQVMNKEQTIQCAGWSLDANHINAVQMKN